MLTHILTHTHTPTHQEPLKDTKMGLLHQESGQCLKPRPHDVLCHPTCSVTKPLLLSQTQIYRSKVCMILAPDSACPQVTIATTLRVRDLSREKEERGDGVHKYKWFPSRSAGGNGSPHRCPRAEWRGVWLNEAEWRWAARKRGAEVEFLLFSSRESSKTKATREQVPLPAPECPGSF